MDVSTRYRRLGKDYRLLSCWNGFRESGVLTSDWLDINSFWIFIVGIIEIDAWSHLENDEVRFTGVCACCGYTLQRVGVEDAFTILYADVH